MEEEGDSEVVEGLMIMTDIMGVEVEVMVGEWTEIGVGVMEGEWNEREVGKENMKEVEEEIVEEIEEIDIRIERGVIDSEMIEIEEIGIEEE